MEIFKNLIFLTLFLSFQIVKVPSIIDFIEKLNLAQEKNLIKIEKFEFKEETLKIKGYVKFQILDEKKDELLDFFKENNIKIEDLSNKENTIYVSENFFSYKPDEFLSIFLYKFYTILSSKYFFLILIITIIFYLLLWGVF